MMYHICMCKKREPTRELFESLGKSIALSGFSEVTMYFH